MIGIGSRTRARSRSSARSSALAHNLGLEVIAEGVETAGAARPPEGAGLRVRPGLPRDRAAASRGRNGAASHSRRAALELAARGRRRLVGASRLVGAREAAVPRGGLVLTRPSRTTRAVGGRNAASASTARSACRSCTNANAALSRITASTASDSAGVPPTHASTAATPSKTTSGWVNCSSRSRGQHQGHPGGSAGSARR